MNIEQYREHIDALIERMDGETVLNGNASHASILNERMFSHAVSSMDIVTRRFDPKIFGTNDLLEAARAFCEENGGKARIAIEEVDVSTIAAHPFVKEFYSNEQVEFRVIPKDLHSIVTANFSVMDGTSFRFERDKKEAVAIASFSTDGGRIATSLVDIFESIWTMCKPLELQLNEDCLAGENLTN